MDATAPPGICCPRCGSLRPERDNFCTQCGSALRGGHAEVRCPRCCSALVNVPQRKRDGVAMFLAAALACVLWSIFVNIVVGIRDPNPMGGAFMALVGALFAAVMPRGAYSCRDCRYRWDSKRK